MFSNGIKKWKYNSYSEGLTRGMWDSFLFGFRNNPSTHNTNPEQETQIAELKMKTTLIPMYGNLEDFNLGMETEFQIPFII